MTDRELMQQALYALEYASDMTKPENMSGCGCPICVTITALRERLAQPEQEPVAWMSIGVIVKSEIPQFYTGPLYTIPPQRKPLTDEQRDAIARQAAENDWHDYEVIDAVIAALPKQEWVGLTDEEIHGAFQNSSRRSIYRVIESKLKEKNT